NEQSESRGHGCVLL
nr:immunoglobulin heavy chain junction region [Homo sapiens]